MAELPIACSLSEPELAARRAGVLADVRANQRGVLWEPDGVRLRFDAEPARLAALAAFVELERRCCAFLRFRLTVEPGGGPVWLELTGPPGTREFLAAELQLGVRPRRPSTSRAPRRRGVRKSGPDPS